MGLCNDGKYFPTKHGLIVPCCSLFIGLLLALLFSLWKIGAVETILSSTHSNIEVQQFVTSFSKTVEATFNLLNYSKQILNSSFSSSTTTTCTLARETKKTQTYLYIKFITNTYIYTSSTMARISALLASCLLAGASAFTAPASQQVQSSALNAKPVNKEIGVQAPVGFFE
jgi:hypothetical protein